jgi:polyisoprenoid-binding protein YceI
VFANDSLVEKNFLVDAAKSSVNWKGSKVGGEHSGVINLDSAQLKFTDDVLSSGEFVVDMTSLKNTDLEKLEDRTKLEKHLKSVDFFETDAFAKSSFKFSNVKDMGNGQYAVTGQMTIKEKSNQETFMTKVNMAGDKLVAVADVKIDRTKYGIMYKAGKDDEDEWFFTKWFKGGKDKLIDNVLELRVNIVADQKKLN